DWSRASRAIGVRSRQLKGMPVWSGVVNRFDSVMMIVYASPFLPFTSRKPSAPAPPALLTTMNGFGESSCFSAMPAMSRAIWSAPPPVPAGTTNSIGLAGSHAAPFAARAPPNRARPMRAPTMGDQRYRICVHSFDVCGPDTSRGTADASRPVARTSRTKTGTAGLDVEPSRLIVVDPLLPGTFLPKRNHAGDLPFVPHL